MFYLLNNSFSILKDHSFAIHVRYVLLDCIVIYLWL